MVDELKTVSSFKLSPKAHELLAQMALRLGLSKAGVLEMAIRKLAEKELATAVRRK